MQSPQYAAASSYFALPALDTDEAPAGATHTVFAGDGSLAGFAAESGTAWERDGSEAGQAGSLAAAVAIVAELDLELLGIAADDTGYSECVLLSCEECSAAPGRPCEAWCISDMAGPR